MKEFQDGQAALTTSYPFNHLATHPSCSWKRPVIVGKQAHYYDLSTQLQGTQYLYSRASTGVATRVGLVIMGNKPNSKYCNGLLPQAFICLSCTTYEGRSAYLPLPNHQIPCVSFLSPVQYDCHAAPYPDALSPQASVILSSNSIRRIARYWLMIMRFSILFFIYTLGLHPEPPRTGNTINEFGVCLYLCEIVTYHVTWSSPSAPTLHTTLTIKPDLPPRLMQTI